MTAGETILVVDDDPRICRLISRLLRRDGFSAHTAASGAEMRSVLEDVRPDLVLLDLMLPDEDGFTLARELRVGSEVGLVILTGRTDTVDKIVGLELGADDYVTKPFDPRELVARIRSVLRRRAGSSSRSDGRGSLARFAGWTLDLDGFELRDEAGRSTHLTSHEFQLLAALVDHGPRVLTRDKILDDVFDRGWSPDDRSVDVLIGRLRRKLGDDARDPKLIRTIRGTGYRLIPKVRMTERASD